MPSFETTRRVPFTAEQMFALVADVERYPEFVPLCEGLRIKSRGRIADAEVLIAEMTVGYKAIRETFTSRVMLRPSERTVTAEAIEGPFRTLDNRWSFTPVTGGCDVRFYISYEIRSLMLQMLAGAVFDKAFRRFADAFEARARQVYGATAGNSLSPA